MKPPSSRHRVIERRTVPDRRTEWRGGRRDEDWTNRPAGRYSSCIPAPPKARRLQSLLAALNMW
jgi:hypothetical protein